MDTRTWNSTAHSSSAESRKNPTVRCVVKRFRTPSGVTQTKDEDTAGDDGQQVSIMLLVSRTSRLLLEADRCRH
jgi:hypothetical protein